MTFEFISHEKYDDLYIAESVVFCIDGKHRVTYIRKKMKNGALFWDVISAGVKVYGEMKYLKSYAQDSKFLDEDLKQYLNSRSWEKVTRPKNEDEFPF